MATTRTRRAAPPEPTPIAQPGPRWPLGRRASAAIILVLALLVLVALIFPGGGIARSARPLLLGLFGAAAPVVALYLGAVAIAVWRPTWATSDPPALDEGRVGEATIPRRGIVGARAIGAWTALLLVAMALLQPTAGDPDLNWSGRGGGVFGWLTYRATVSAFGESAAVLVLFGLGLLALLVAFAVTPRELWRAATVTGHRTARVVTWIARLIFPSPSDDPDQPDLVPIPRARPTRSTPSNSKAVAPVPAEPPVPPVPGSDRWALPAIDLLNAGTPGELIQADIEKKARAIEEALAEFDVYARVVEVNPGPTVTQFGLQPGFRERKDRHGNIVRRDKIKVSEILSLHNDLALALAAPSIRIEAPVPGRQVVGLEVPNGSTGIVSLRELLQSPEFQRVRQKSRLAVALGKDVSGHPVAIDLARAPHLLIAGATGSGKSACINSLISSLLLNCTPEDLRLIMVDPKRVELTGYNGVPHLLRDVVVDVDKMISVLRWVTHEMDERYKRFEQVGVRNIDGFNRRAVAQGAAALHFLVVIIDELADIMLAAAEEIEPALCRLAQMSRAVGIHLVVATQRPSVDVITGLIKANFPTRIAFAVTSQVDSRTIIDSVGAEKLLGRGDMLYLASDAPKPVRLQGSWVSDPEIEGIIQAWQVQGTPQYVEALVNAPSSATEDDGDDELYERAIEVARQHSRVSTSLLQRRLRVGYPRAARLLALLEERGVISQADNTRPPEVVVREDADGVEGGST